MTRYHLPEALGGGEIEATENWGGCAGGRPEYDLAGGIVLTMPAGQPLEPVAPTIPAEPEPGAYLIGGRLVVRFAADGTANPWAVETDGVVGGFAWSNWRALWEEVGGPDVTITPLVALPTVELPWTATDLSDCTARVYRGVFAGMKAVIDRTSDNAGDETLHAYLPDTAEAKGWALIAAARAAREADHG